MYDDLYNYIYNIFIRNSLDKICLQLDISGGILALASTRDFL